ncbi:MAG TPA: SDR family oxidoreductase [Methylovorus sp.]|jgi:NAD(P)-dependent dehydrogenase (short-subunit alcohol dehydrogenase family)|nr:SDR family oxidoreductase [Methylovorus sp.]
MPTLLVTGANRGLGLEFTRQYAEAGWQVHACCRNPEDSTALKALHLAHLDRISLHKLDVADFQQIDQLAESLADTPIDVLLNNAGVYPDHAGSRLSDADYEAWQTAFRINSMSPLKMAQAFAAQVAASQEKKIINMTSKMGSIADNGSGGSYIYRSSKTALNSVTKSLAIDLANQGISVLAMHPGWVQTDMGGPNGLINAEQSVSGMRQVIAKLKPQQSGQFIAYDGQAIPW